MRDRTRGKRPLVTIGGAAPAVVVTDPAGHQLALPYSAFAAVIGVTDKITGPGSATDNALVRFDGTTGKLVQNGQVLESDDGRLTTLTNPSGAQDAATKAYVDAAALIGIAAAQSFVHDFLFMA